MNRKAVTTAERVSSISSGALVLNPWRNSASKKRQRNCAQRPSMLTKNSKASFIARRNSLSPKKQVSTMTANLERMSRRVSTNLTGFLASSVSDTRVTPRLSMWRWKRSRSTVSGVQLRVTVAPVSRPATRTGMSKVTVARTMEKRRYMVASSSSLPSSIMAMAPLRMSTKVLVCSAMRQRSTTARRRWPVRSVRYSQTRVRSSTMRASALRR
mmetsp:Transcript_13100/g.50071  ORF Transcript_13100/g.50071 Transcript_13100/m.50071 type:complete len:213 (-) Transcript_13100:811-1449(-)